MFYQELIQELMKDKSNPVNSMYLHEIELLWKKFLTESEKLNDENANKQILKNLNKFIQSINNSKFKQHFGSQKGFALDSLLFSSYYLNDVISLIMQKNKILNNKGIKWGFQSFSTNISFKPRSIFAMEKKTGLKIEESENLLQLTQQMDMQFRISGKRFFSKYRIVLPLLVFQTCKNFCKEDFITLDYYSKLAKNTFECSKTMVLCETIDKNFDPVLKRSSIDSIFILRKQHVNKQLADFDSAVLNAFESKISDYVIKENANINKMIKNGEIIKRGFYEK
jgi:hypothetical protein